MDVREQPHLCHTEQTPKSPTEDQRINDARVQRIEQAAALSSGLLSSRKGHAVVIRLCERKKENFKKCDTLTVFDLVS